MSPLLIQINSVGFWWSKNPDHTIKIVWWSDFNRFRLNFNSNVIEVEVHLRTLYLSLEALSRLKRAGALRLLSTHDSNRECGRCFSKRFDWMVLLCWAPSARGTSTSAPHNSTISHKISENTFRLLFFIRKIVRHAL